MKNNHGFSNILIIVIGLLIIGVGGYFGYSYLYNPSTTVRISTPQNAPVSQQITKEDTKKPQEIEFKGLDNCPKAECKNLEVTRYIQFVDKEFGTLYKIKGNLSPHSDVLQFNKNQIYFITYTLNKETEEVIEEKIYSLNINNGVYTELMSSKSKINSFLVSNNIIYYSLGKTCGVVCPDPENTYGHKLYSYNIDTKETIKLNSKNLTDSGYDIAPYSDKFSFESGKINIYKLENNKLIMSFGQMTQAAERFFYFNLDTKEVKNIGGTEWYYEELDKKTKELGVRTGNSKLFIRNGNFEIELMELK
jgi:hypothetical protein